MVYLALAVLPFLQLSAYATPAGIVNRRVASQSARSAAALAPQIPAAEHAVALGATAPRPGFKGAAMNTLLGHHPKHEHNHKHGSSSLPIAILAGSGFDEEYLTNITIGGQKFSVIVDTGSSDTWVVEKGFSCFNLTGSPQSSDTCAFGPTYDPKKSSTYKAYPDHVFNIEYADLEYLYGTVGFETVSVGGLTVTSQEFGVVNQAAWEGDGINSGLFGLAYPGLTSVYNGTDPTTASANTSAPYNPVFFTAVAEKKVANPYFSVALNRGSFSAQENSNYDPNLGYVAFGGIAPVNVTKAVTTVPVQGYAVSPISSTTGKTYFFYTVDVQSYTFPGSATLHTANNSTILDTGTTLNYVPTAVAKAYNAKFSPPATYHADEDTYYVSCTAKVPPFSAVIGGISFSVDGRDQILPVGTDARGRELCISGTQNGGADTDGNIFVLGDVFLHNVVATFNIQTELITLSQRSPY